MTFTIEHDVFIHLVRKHHDIGTTYDFCEFFEVDRSQQAAGRVGEIEHGQAGLDRVLGEHLGQCSQVEAVARMAGNFDDLEAKAFGRNQVVT